MNILFTVSYRDDLRWLRWSQASIKRFCAGFDKVVVVCPDTDIQLIEYVRSLPGVTCVVQPNGEPGHMIQQCWKLSADTLSGVSGDDCIMYVDSDFIFRQDTRPEFWKRDGKPIVWADRWESAGSPWRHGTERVLGFKTKYETMRCPVLCFPARAIAGARAQLEAVAGTDLRTLSLRAWDTSHDFYPQDRYVGQQRGMPGYSEFNVLGNFALEYMPNDIYLNLVFNEGCPPHPWLQQGWSHAAPTQEQAREWISGGIHI